MGRTSLPDPPSRHPSGCRILGIAPHYLDPYCPASYRGDSLESQTAKEPFLLASYLEAREELGKRSGIERFFGRVFLFFRRERSSSHRMVSYCFSSRLNLHCFDYCRSCRLECSAS